MTEYTALFPFCGIGGGALGFKRAEVSMFGRSARFRIVGGIDFDSASCRDFENIVAAPALCRDIRDLSPSELLELCPEAPDVVFLSPPCKGASGLLSAKKARTRRYREMNRLALRWIELMLATWPTPPRLVLLENVPRLKQRAGGMLRRVRSLLHRAGYVFHDGFHECGELGGLAQIRRRYLLVARRPSACPSLLYQPPRKRVRGCGEVLGPLPMPGDPAGGAMHRLPRISWLNWVRLALIPAGGDWRDLEGVLRDGQPRREVFKRHGVQRWEEPSATVAGSGSNGPSAVADPRIDLGTCKPNSHYNKYRVESWDAPAHTVIGATRPGSGAPSVADQRAAEVLGVKGAYDHGYGILRFEEPSPTVAGGSYPGQGAYAVADPRVRSFVDGETTQSRAPSSEVLGKGREDGHVLDLDRHEDPAWVRGARYTPTWQTHCDSSASLRVGAHVWSDPGRASRTARVRQPELCPAGTPASWHSCSKHGRDGSPGPRWQGVSQTEHEAELRPGSRNSSFESTGGRLGEGVRCFTADDLRHSKRQNQSESSAAEAVVDRLCVSCSPRSGSYRVLSWEEAARTVTGSARIDNGPFAVADPRKPPDFTPVIIAADGTWHRPLTTLELAVLQGFPAEIDGKPLELDGTSQSAWRERIGNAVPPPAAQAIAERMLVALVEADMGGFSLRSDDLPVWVEQEEALS